MSSPLELYLAEVLGIKEIVLTPHLVNEQFTGEQLAVGRVIGEPSHLSGLPEAALVVRGDLKSPLWFCAPKLSAEDVELLERIQKALKSQDAAYLALDPDRSTEWGELVTRSPSRKVFFFGNAWPPAYTPPVQSLLTHLPADLHFDQKKKKETWTALQEFMRE